MCDLSRGQYFGMLKWLSRHTNRIEWVVSCNDLPDTLLAELFAPAVFEKKTVTVWTGTVSRDVSLLFVLRPDPVIFREFMTYSGFSDWGNRDIAFFGCEGRTAALDHRSRKSCQRSEGSSLNEFISIPAQRGVG